MSFNIYKIISWDNCNSDIQFYKLLLSSWSRMFCYLWLLYFTFLTFTGEIHWKSARITCSEAEILRKNISCFVFTFWILIRVFRQMLSHPTQTKAIARVCVRWRESILLLILLANNGSDLFSYLLISCKLFLKKTLQIWFKEGTILGRGYSMAS